MIQRQSPRNQTLYADLLQEVAASVLPGGRGLSFTVKSIKGRRYWYLSVAVGKNRLQTYLGADTQELSQRIEAVKAGWTQAQANAPDRRRLIAHLVSGGAAATVPAAGSIIAILADGGVFRAGAVLIGSVAFQAYANMLGVRWPSGEVRTQDIDVATDPIGVAVLRKGVRLSDILDEAGGFAAVPGLLWKDPSTSFTGRGLRVDLLTPMRGRARNRPVFVKRIGAYAEPLRFLDFLIEDAQLAVLLAKDGIVVNVPHPARFALHKLVISEQRGAAWATKVGKDLSQAALILEVLLEDMPGSLIEALDAARAYPDKFYRTVLSGARKLPEPIRGELRKMAEELEAVEK
jgi:hypothetical protein